VFTQSIKTAPISAAATTAVPDAADTETESCEVSLVAPCDGFALVPCGHARFSQSW